MTTEVKVNIPPNNYIQPTEPRAEVVQALCNAFLRRNSSWRTFHPFCDGYGRNADIRIDIACPYFDHPSPDGENVRKIHGCEVQAAFAALRKAGYHMFCIYEHGTWKGYVCEKTPFLQKGVEVTRFDDFIDY